MVILNLIQSHIHLQSFVPHGECWLWDYRMIMLQLGSNLLIVVAYYAISSLLLYILIKTRENPYIRSRALLLYMLFIFLCGTTHIIDIITIYRPIYWTDGFVRLMTGIVSVMAAIETIRVVKETIADINKYYLLIRPRIDDALTRLK